MKYIRNWFSNMLPFDVPMVDDLFHDIEYNTPEHAYQSHKTNSHDARVLIATSPLGTGAKKLGRRVPHVENWDSIKFGVMVRVQQYRFGDSTQWKKRLLSYSGEIIEVNNWHDNLWGDCACEKCSDIKGHNLLGSILMNIRMDHKQKNTGIIRDVVEGLG